MAEVFLAVADLVDGRRFWRADRLASSFVVELGSQIQFAGLARNRESLRVAADRDSDCFCRLVSRTGQDISARLFITSVSAVGGFEIRPADCNHRNRVDGRPRSVGRATRIRTVYRA